MSKDSDPTTRVASSTQKLFTSTTCEVGLHVRCNWFIVLLLLGCLMLWPRALIADAPGLLWSTNVGARLFAVDEELNSYANAGGAVIKINSQGQAVLTNSICPLPGLALRDANGDFYFAGVLNSHFGPSVWLEFEPQDFGGVVLSNLPFFLVKYSANGTLLWATNFGPAGVLRGAEVDDVAFCGENILVGYRHHTSTTDFSPMLSRFTVEGDHLWAVGLPKKSGWSSTIGKVRLTPASATDGFALTYIGSSGREAKLSSFHDNGAVFTVTNWPSPYEYGDLVPRVVLNPAGQLFNVEGFDGMNLTKRQGTGAGIWQLYIGNDARRVVGPDQFGGVHVASDAAQLFRFDINGNLDWTMNLPATCRELFLTGGGSRFLSLANGAVARLAGESLVAPLVTNAPVGQTVMVGSNASFSVSAIGTTPLSYYWKHSGNPIATGTNATFSLTNVTTAQAGEYTVVVSNHVGSITSAPALLRVKNVAIFANNQLLTNGTHVFSNPPTFTIRSAFTNGTIFYTLNGSAPSFASIPYTGPFQLSTNATIRALGYSADFLQSEEADIVNAVVVGQRTLTVNSGAGGGVLLSPPGGFYADGETISATAVASNGWSFLYWTGDASGNNPTVNVEMDGDKNIAAVFGTKVTTTVAGNGEVLLHPPGGVYSNGTTVRLTAVPQPGNYFGFWGNAANGNSNPLYFTVTNPNPTVSSIFGALTPDTAALTVLIAGHGQVQVNPAGNVFPTNQTVTITAISEAGATFNHWSGDASGNQNPLSVSMTQSRVIVANFSGQPHLVVNDSAADALDADGFHFTLFSDPQSIYRILASTNLINWTEVGVVTNIFGETTFTDSSATNLPAQFYKASP